MASSKVMASSKSKTSDLSSSSASASSRSKLDQFRALDHHNFAPSPACTMTVDSILRNVYSTPSAESTLLDAQITLIDTPAPTLSTPPEIERDNSNYQEMNGVVNSQGNKTVDDVWREIVAGRKELKAEPEERMTLEEFLNKTGVADAGEEDEVKMPPGSGGVYGFDLVPSNAFQVEGSSGGYGNGLEMVSVGGGSRAKRGRAALMEPLDKAAQQRQRRMIKNRESAARSRERKQVISV